MTAIESESGWARSFARRMGARRMIVGTTVISIVVSVAIAVTVVIATGSATNLWISIGIATLAPAVIAPSVSFVFYGLLERLDHAEEAQRRTVQELQEALAQVKTLSGLLPVCAACKNVRDDDGYWHRVEDWMSRNSDAEITHGLCPGCIREHYPEHYDEVVRESA